MGKKVEENKPPFVYGELGGSEHTEKQKFFILFFDSFSLARKWAAQMGHGEREFGPRTNEERNG